MSEPSCFTVHGCYIGDDGYGYTEIVHTVACQVAEEAKYSRPLNLERIAALQAQLDAMTKERDEALEREAYWMKEAQAWVAQRDALAAEAAGLQEALERQQRVAHAAVLQEEALAAELRLVKGALCDECWRRCNKDTTNG